MELPPRARRIHGVPATPLTLRGTTSACAENTTPPTPNIGPCGNYLRVRGEYCPMNLLVRTRMELPPRARRIRRLARHCLSSGGTTSACAENTVSIVACRMSIRNYLRVRGEYAARGQAALPAGELPPRARRIPAIGRSSDDKYGTTSACAENTLCLSRKPTFLWNYLRVRGEYTFVDGESGDELELPPRARRIPLNDFTNFLDDGTTSACAENTGTATATPAGWGNYLRVRGEYLRLPGRCPPWWELPPRARRILIVFPFGAN